MKCALIFLSVVVFSYAVPISFGEGKQVTIDKEGTITILGENGKKIVISKVIGHPGPKDIEIFVGGPEGPHKKIDIDLETNTKTLDLIDPSVADYYQTHQQEDREKRSSKVTKESSKNSKDQKSQSHADLLNEIFAEYLGVVDKKSYDDLLSKVNTYVQSGVLNENVYNVLRSLDDYKVAEKLGYNVAGNQPVRSGYPVNYHPYYPVNSYPVNYPVNSHPVNYPVNAYPYREENYPIFDQQRVNYPYYGYGYNDVYPENRFRGLESGEDIQGVRDIYAYPRNQFYGQSKDQLFGVNRLTPVEQQYIYQGQYQQPQQSTLNPSSSWSSYVQQRQMNKPIPWTSVEH